MNHIEYLERLAAKTPEGEFMVAFSREPENTYTDKGELNRFRNSLNASLGFMARESLPHLLKLARAADEVERCLEVVGHGESGSLRYCQFCETSQDARDVRALGHVSTCIAWTLRDALEPLREPLPESDGAR